MFSDIFRANTTSIASMIVLPQSYKNYRIRSWESRDRHIAAEIVGSVLAEYGLPWEPEGADRDVLNVEECYHYAGGEFWVVERQGIPMGTAAYYPVQRGEKAVEFRKMYLLPQARGQGLGKFLLELLERAAGDRGFETAWVETASVLTEAVRLYERNGYQPALGVETPRCDRIYVKPLRPS